MHRFTLNVAPTCINLEHVLLGGQSFRWKKTEANTYCGVAHRTAWKLRQSPHEISVQVLGSLISHVKEDPLFAEKLLRHYLSLDVDLETLASTWIASCEHVAKLYPNMRGIRILRQDPVENLFSFICSSNNNIARISKMVEAISTHFGEIIPVDGSTDVFHAFPSPNTLASSEAEAALRRLGLGYRAKFIHKSAQRLVALANGEASASDLKTGFGDRKTGFDDLKTGFADRKTGPSDQEIARSDGSLELSDILDEYSRVILRKFGSPESSYDDAHARLQEFEGIGAKVADCICLMSLNHHCAVPVDTHVLQVTCKYYMPNLVKGGRPPNLSTKLYKEIGNFYRSKFGDYAGWAHDILFCAELKHLAPSGSTSGRKRRITD